MKTNYYKKLLVVLCLFFPLSVLAQSDDFSYSLYENDFSIGIGGFFPSKDFTLRVDGSVPGEEVDFDELFRVDDDEATGALQFRWRFGEKWAVEGQYWKVSDSGSSTLEEDIHWQDVVFEKGTNVGAGVDLEVARVFFGRIFSSSPHHEFGLGLGFHWLELGAYLEGQIFTSEGDSEFYRGSVGAEAPLPNIGAWYSYAFSSKWAFRARADWLDVSFNEYSGGLWNAQLGVHWATFENIGFTAAWNFFGLDVDVDKDSWHGAAEISQDGPFIGLIASW